MPSRAPARSSVPRPALTSVSRSSCVPLGSVTSQSSGPAFQPHRLRLALDEMDSASSVDDTSAVRLRPLVPSSDQAVPGAVVTARSPHDSSSSTRADDPNDPCAGDRRPAVGGRVGARRRERRDLGHGDEHRAEHQARHGRRDDATGHGGAGAAEHEAGADRDDGQRPPGERVGDADPRRGPPPRRGASRRPRRRGTLRSTANRVSRSWHPSLQERSWCADRAWIGVIGGSARGSEVMP